MRKSAIIILALLLCGHASAEKLKYAVQYDIPYKESQDAYAIERCRLDICYPKDTAGCAVVVWFHGGGLTQGSKSFPWKLKEKGMVLVAVGYHTDADDIAGLIPFSGQMISHFSYREMKGIGNLQPTIDEYAPLFHVRKDAPPLILITGDRDIELFGRHEENAYMWRMMKLTGHADTYLYEIDGHGHGSMAEPAYHILENHVKKITGMPVDNN